MSTVILSCSHRAERPEIMKPPPEHASMQELLQELCFVVRYLGISLTNPHRYYTTLALTISVWFYWLALWYSALFVPTEDVAGQYWLGDNGFVAVGQYRLLITFVNISMQTCSCLMVTFSYLYDDKLLQQLDAYYQQLKTFATEKEANLTIVRYRRLSQTYLFYMIVSPIGVQVMCLMAKPRLMESDYFINMMVIWIAIITTNMSLAIHYLFRLYYLSNLTVIMFNKVHQETVHALRWPSCTEKLFRVKADRLHQAIRKHFRVCLFASQVAWYNRWAFISFFIMNFVSIVNMAYMIVYCNLPSVWMWTLYFGYTVCNISAIVIISRRIGTVTKAALRGHKLIYVELVIKHNPLFQRVPVQTVYSQIVPRHRLTLSSPPLDPSVHDHSQRLHSQCTHPRCFH